MAMRKQRSMGEKPCTQFVVRGRSDGSAPMSFPPEIETDHWRFDPARHDDIYIVGDVHGCIDELRTLWDRLNPSGNDLVVFVGDLVRKGPASVEVVEFVAESEHAVSVRGNNEAKIVHDRIDTDPYEEVADTLGSFPLVISFGEAIVVHGGIDPTKPLEEQTARELLEMRSVPPGNGYSGPFWFDRHDGPWQVFFGHTVLGEPLVSDGAVGLDTGCVYGGALTAYDYNSGDIAQVPANETYQERSDNKILDV
jgi:serine/threonine protein phosphatase 1